MESGQEQAQNSSVQVSAAGESLQTVFSKIQSLNSINAQIAEEALQQTAVANAIDNNIQAITQIATQTSTSSEQINQASHELARLAANLNHLTDRFQV
jgi:methyl-accepting chemotaxis protein